MPVCKGLINLFGENLIAEINQLYSYNIGTKEHNVYANYSIYDLWHIIYSFDEDYLKTFAINKLRIKNEIRTSKKGDIIEINPIVKFKNDNFSSSYADLSLKAMCKIIPFLQEGFLYNEAVLLAKIPDNYSEWETKKQLVFNIIKDSNREYNYNKEIIGISNSLINEYKGLDYNEKFAQNNYEYTLENKDIEKIKEKCISFFGSKTWDKKENKEKIINDVKNHYQNFFQDLQHQYRELPTLTNIIKEQFSKAGINIDGNLYHHSDKINIYKKPEYNTKYKKELLSIPLIDSIKNPMFNKTMSVLRKLMNELIIKGDIDEDTDVIVEVARELNDNNKRIAIERYQNERKNNRDKYSEFINEFKVQAKGTSHLNVENSIPVFEMWIEQTFEKAIDDKGNEVNNNQNSDIRKEKNAIKRYELWSEQKGQCMYTGKMIGISQLFKPEIEIEHTIPRSLLPDNTMANQTVCYSKYNSDIKNNKIPAACPNYEHDKDFGTAIKPRLERWEKTRDYYKKQYKDNQKPFGNESEDNKNKRIQDKHYFRMHFDYWHDKVNRFTTKEIKDSWARRQLVDTQMVSKYAREFLKTYFKKVTVQKGSVTADFRKIFGFQEEDEIKSRNKHTHHSIDAAVLTLIPTNSSKRVGVLNKMYEMQENKQGQFIVSPEGFDNFDAQQLIDLIDNNTLIVNYQKDKITEQTYRNVRKRGKLQYLKDKNGKYILDNDNEKIPLKAQGTSIRGELFQQTFIGKIKNVKRDNTTKKPIRNKDNSFQYKTGKEEYTYTVRKPIADAKIDDIIDPDIRKRIIEQKQNGIDISKIKDHQGNIIRHVRIKTKAGKKVKDRLNYKSKNEYKNSFYSAAGEIPYAIFLTNSKNETIERKMIPVAIHEVAQVYKDIHKFDVDYYLNKFHPKIEEYQDKKILKVGQKVFVLKNDNEFEDRNLIEFQMNRMYIITQFKYDGSKIMLKYHLEAQSKSDIDLRTKSIKSNILNKIEKELNITEISENINIENAIDRKKDMEKRLIDFSNRLKNIKENSNNDTFSRYKKMIEYYKTESSKIEKEGETPILGFSKNSWNFLFENYDFNIDITGRLKWIEE